jgi:hypothetical protein
MNNITIQSDSEIVIKGVVICDEEKTITLPPGEYLVSGGVFEPKEDEPRVIKKITGIPDSYNSRSKK